MNEIINQLKNTSANDSVVVVQSTIAGYHIFQIRLLPGVTFPLLVNRETANTVHANALLVKTASKDKYPTSVQTFVSKQKLDVFEKEVGRCPRRLADLVAPLFEQHNIVKGRSICSGKRIFMGHELGGGQHLECLYLSQTKYCARAKQL